MRCIACGATALVALLTLALAHSAIAQDDMSSEADSGVMTTSIADDYGADCCETDCNSQGHTYGEIQYVSLQSYSNFGIFTGTGNEGGVRVVAGYENCNGAGIRLRYFDYNGVTEDFFFGSFGIETSSFDIEATHSFGLCGINGVISAGYRHTNYEVILGLIPPFGIDFDFEGDGLTFGLQFDWEICHNFSLYAWGQQSFIFGEEPLIGDILGRLSECQVGGQYSMCLGGSPTFIRAGAEAQYHDGLLVTTSTGLWGWFLSAGVDF